MSEDAKNRLLEVLGELRQKINNRSFPTNRELFRFALDFREELDYGVEIEFERCDGLTNERPREYWEELFAENLEDWLLVNVPGMNRQAASYFHRNIHGSVEDFIQQFTAADYETEIERLEEQNSSDDFADVKGWKTTEESTQGIIVEYVTEDGSGFHDTLERVNTLFHDAGNFVIPYNGSCHVHINFRGMEHNLSENSALHGCILWELSQLQELFPSCLKSRFELFEHKYFCFDNSSQQKMTCVRSHPQGTLEFRLWGAADDTEDVERFLELSCAAFLLGYLRFSEGRYDREIFRDCDKAKLFRSQFRDSMLSGNPLEECEIDPFPGCADVWGGMLFTIASGLALGGEYPGIEEQIVNCRSPRALSFGYMERAGL